jgi:hypothetical protein
MSKQPNAQRPRVRLHHGRAVDIDESADRAFAPLNGVSPRNRARLALMHSVNKYGVFDAEKVCLGRHARAHAIAKVAVDGFGKWHAGYDFRDSGGGVCSAASVYDLTVHGSRQDAIDSVVGMACRHFSRRLASEHAWLEARVHTEAKEILAQIDVMIAGARKKASCRPTAPRQTAV